VYVDQLELVHGVNSRQMIQLIIQDIASRVPWAQAAYWERRDRPKSQLRTYQRGHLLREEVVGR